MTRLKIQYRKTESLRPYKRNARTHSKKQIRQIAESMEKFGFTNPVLITRDGEIIAGHGRLEAAKLLGMDQVPTIVLEDLTPDERRAYVIADNKLVLNAGWDSELLAIELGELSELGLAEFTGFSTTEIDITLDGARDSDPIRDEPAPEDTIERSRLKLLSLKIRTRSVLYSTVKNSCWPALIRMKRRSGKSDADQ